MKEMTRLWTMMYNLANKVTIVPCHDGFQMSPADPMTWEESWDVVWHSGSYGYDQGLLEVWVHGEPDVRGWMTAEEVVVHLRAAGCIW